MIRSLTVIATGFIACGMVASSTWGADRAGVSSAEIPGAAREFFKSYCLDCHSGPTPEANVRLDDLALVVHDVQTAERWQKVLNELNSGSMPPEDAEQPDKIVKTEILDELSAAMVRVRKQMSDDGGTITMRRLNRREYQNTIRELLGVEVNVRDLPSDVGSGSMDTVGASLFMSSDQFEQYLAIGRGAIRAAIDRCNAPETPKKERRESETLANIVVGGTYNGYYKGGYTASQAYLDSDRSQPAKSFGANIADEDEAKFRVKVFKQHGPSFERYLADPLSKTGALLGISNTHTQEIVALPPETSTDWDKRKLEAVAPGDYRIRISLGAIPGTPAERHYVDLGSKSAEVDFALMDSFQITGTVDEPQLIEVPVTITANGPRSFVFREHRDVSLDHDWYNRVNAETGVGPVPALWVDWVEWEGPLRPSEPPSSLVKLIAAIQSDAPEGVDARAVIADFTIRAFRGVKPDLSYIDHLVSIYKAQRSDGAAIDDALIHTLGVVLASPGFLYISETPGRISDRELVVRLAYFLWSSPPDWELYRLARDGKLHDPQVIASQVDRMIADKRSYHFATGFVSQWLGMDRLDFFQFNTKLYPKFSDATKEAAREEVYRTFEYWLRSGGSLRELLRSDTVVINALLADYYGIAGVTGDAYRPVKVPPGDPRGGFLGMSAVLAMGGNGEHTSPVERGAWVLRKLLDDPPPPAPANVPQLTRLEGQLLTTRERLVAHQEEPQCASCHRKIDPIGFGLENFDAVGQWRTDDAYKKPGVGEKTWKIDAAGAFHNGPEFKDFYELRELIVVRSDDFARGFIKKLIEYSLGRPYGFADERLTEALLERAKVEDLSIHKIIQDMVASQAFKTK